MSEIRFADIVDGLSQTIIVGERSSEIGGSTWTGVIPEANSPIGRIVGATFHVPNDRTLDFEDFRSLHATGAQFLLADGSVRIINDQISLSVYQALSTRAGGEVAQPGSGQ